MSDAAESVASDADSEASSAHPQLMDTFYRYLHERLDPYIADIRADLVVGGIGMAAFYERVRIIPRFQTMRALRAAAAQVQDLHESEHDE